MAKKKVAKGNAPSDFIPDAVERAAGEVTHRQRQQYAALPYRVRDDGQYEVMLITSRTTRRWIIPKGWPMGDKPPHKVAAREALEEAGIEGQIGKKPIGHYHYKKLLTNGNIVHCRVEVFALHVEKQKSAWPERKVRERQWLSVEDAAERIDDREFAPVILSWAQVLFGGLQNG